MATRKQLCNLHEISCFMHTNTCDRLGLGWVHQSSLAGCHSFIRIGRYAANRLSTLYEADGKTKAAAQRPRVYGATGHKCCWHANKHSYNATNEWDVDAVSGVDGSIT